MKKMSNLPFFFGQRLFLNHSNLFPNEKTPPFFRQKSGRSIPSYTIFNLKYIHLMKIKIIII